MNVKIKPRGNRIEIGNPSGFIRKSAKLETEAARHRKMEDTKTKKSLYRVFWVAMWVIYIPVYLVAATVYLVTTPATFFINFLAFLIKQTESFCRLG